MKFKNLITVIDSRTEGQSTRMVTSGYPKIPGKTMVEKRDFVSGHAAEIAPRIASFLA